MNLWLDEAARRREFPVCGEQIFLAHAAVCALPRRVAQAEIDYVTASSRRALDFSWVTDQVRRTREAAAKLLPGAGADEIALLGPTALGLSLVAEGLDWVAGDEVVYHADCYPANVYPWMNLARRGVKPVPVHTDQYGEITREAIEAALTPHTRLVALASAHFVTGHRIDLGGIGAMLQARGILFCVDAIQTLGAFELDVTHVDFLSADAHKWMLGPAAIGVVMVKRTRFERLRPILLGASNVRCPDYMAQSEIVLRDRADRYEAGVLNIGPMLGMCAGLELLAEVGIDSISERILSLKRSLLRGLEPLGFAALGPVDGPHAAGMLTLRHPTADLAALHRACLTANIVASLRKDRAGTSYLRFSPHFYNTAEEMARVAEFVRATL